MPLLGIRKSQRVWIRKGKATGIRASLGWSKRNLVAKSTKSLLGGVLVMRIVISSKVAVHSAIRCMRSVKTMLWRLGFRGAAGYFAFRDFRRKTTAFAFRPFRHDTVSAGKQIHVSPNNYD